MRDKDPTFSQIVCSSPAVQTAFGLHRTSQFWWTMILLLHGKPVNHKMSQSERIKRVAEGFKFYAGLYRLLAVIFFLLAPALWAMSAIGCNLSYWAAASVLAGIYLWGVSGLGYAGSKSYGNRQAQGTSSLVAFMVMIVAFLSMFIAVVSVVIHRTAGAAIVPNMAATSALFAFGVGSYMIEIIYLATERP